MNFHNHLLLQYLFLFLLDQSWITAFNILINLVEHRFLTRQSSFLHFVDLVQQDDYNCEYEEANEHLSDCGSYFRLDIPCKHLHLLQIIAIGVSDLFEFQSKSKFLYKKSAESNSIESVPE